MGVDTAVGHYSILLPKQLGWLVGAGGKLSEILGNHDNFIGAEVGDLKLFMVSKESRRFP